MAALERESIVSDIAPSPIVAIVDALRAHNASWGSEVGRFEGPGWIAGTDLRNPSTGPFDELLTCIGKRAGTGDRRTIAASFALRYGWASAMAIAPYFLYDCVPDVSLENISLKFRSSTFLERTAIHRARGVLLADAQGAGHPDVTLVNDRHQLLKTLRTALVDQASPVVEALYRWAGFSRRGTWGLLTSSWAAHLTGFFRGDDQRDIEPVIDELFIGDDVVATMRPRLHPVTCRQVTHLYQRRASCCRWYLLPGGELCTSCPLVPDAQRLIKNRAWMEAQLDRSGERRGHR